MSGSLLFPKIGSGLKWVVGRSDAVIQFGWNTVTAMILLFAGKLIAHLLSRGLEKLLLKCKVGRTIIQFFTTLVHYIVYSLYISPSP